MQKSNAAEQDKEFIEAMAIALSDTQEQEKEAARIIADAIPLIDRLLFLKK